VAVAQQKGRWRTHVPIAQAWTERAAASPVVASVYAVNARRLS